MNAAAIGQEPEEISAEELRALAGAFSPACRCSHRNEYWTGSEREVDYALFTVHYYEYYCPDCNKSYCLTWKPPARA